MIKSVVRGVIKLFLGKIFYRVKYIGVENLNKYDKCLICPNHSNTVEPAWIYAVTKDIAIMAKAELFENKILAKIFKYFNVFPIRRGKHDIRSLIHAINLFKDVEKMKLLVFPEGERLKKDTERLPAKIGPAYIASKVNVPMIPVYISKNVKLFSRVDIIFGEPIFSPKDKNTFEKFSNEFMDTVYNLPKKIKNK